MPAIARNLGLTGRRQRLWMGMVFLAIALGGAVALIMGGLPRGARLALVLPFYLGSVGLLQYRDHT